MTLNLKDLKKQEKFIELKGEKVDESGQTIQSVLQVVYSSPSVEDMEEITREGNRLWFDVVLPEVRKMTPSVQKIINGMTKEELTEQIVSTEMAIADTISDLVDFKNENILTVEEKETRIKQAMETVKSTREEVLKNWDIEELRQRFLIWNLRPHAGVAYQAEIVPVWLSVLCKDSKTKERVFSYQKDKPNYIKDLDAQLYNELCDAILPLIKTPLEQDIRRLAESPDFLFYTDSPVRVDPSPIPTI